MLQHAILDLKVFAYNATSVSICINLYKFLKDFLFICCLKPSVLMADHLFIVFAYSVKSLYVLILIKFLNHFVIFSL